MNDSPSAARLRVATWNLWWRHGSWQQRQPAIAQTLRTIDADIVGLQEVSSADPDQPSWLRDELGYHVAVSPDGDHDPHGIVNAIASRWPIVDTSWGHLDVGTMVPHRTVLRATVDAPVGPIDVHCTHLSHGFHQSALRTRQLRQVAQMVARRRSQVDHVYPALLLGDLNAVPDSDEIRMLTGRSEPAADGLVFTDVWEHAGAGPGATYSDANPYVVDSAWPERRLDYVLVSWPRQRPCGNPMHAELFGTEAIGGTVPTDHYGVVADLHAFHDDAEATS